MTVLTAENICKEFAGQGSDPVAVLRGVDLSLAKGEFVAVRGRSGSGKSTLLHVLAGLDNPSSGSVAFLGQELASMSSRELLALRRESFGFVFQFFNLLPGLDVRDNVALPLMLNGAGREVAAERSAELIAAVGLEHRASHLAANLSGGEKQRVAVARALAPQPEVVFADEPTGNLDRRSGEQVLELLAELCSENDSALLVVTHDDFVSARADRVCELVDGKLSIRRDQGAAGGSDPQLAATTRGA